MGVDKVKRYEWSKYDEDNVVYTEIPIDKLRVDHTYQRDGISKSRVLRIARDFNRAFLGVLTVVKRNGLYYVVDGQNRLEAAKKRNDVPTLPCAVLESKGIKFEARCFKQINETSNAVSAYHKYKAAVVAGDEPEKSINEWTRSYGFRMTRGGTGNGKKDICFIGTLVQKWKTDSQAAKDAVLSMHRLAMTTDHMEGRPFLGFWYLFHRGVDLRKYEDKIAKAGGLPAVYHSINVTKIEAGNMEGEKISATGILRIINKGKRNKIRLIAEDE